MQRLLTFPRLSIIFVGLFAVCMAGLFAYDRLVTEQGRRCEARGGWWDGGEKVCAQPISIAELTGRPLPGERAAASQAANADLVRIEHALADQKRARDAEIERQRAVLATNQ